MDKNPPIPSSWNDDLTKNPNGKYKFGSFELTLSSDKKFHSRQTYGLLMLLGDIGGLFGALQLIAQALLMPYNKFKLNTFLMTQLFRFKPRSKPDVVVESTKI